MSDKIRKFLAAESGATVIEYGLLAGLIAVAILGTLSVLGNSLEQLFNNGTAELIESKSASVN